MQNSKKATAVGINHIALEVGSIDEALEFYGALFDFEIESRSDRSAFIYFGDQFINFMTPRSQGPDSGRHFGIAVDDKEAVRDTLIELDVKILDPGSRFLDFLDPWGNRVEITTYQNIQFSKSDNVLSGMGLGHIMKTENALKELRAKGLEPDLD